MCLRTGLPDHHAHGVPVEWRPVPVHKRSPQLGFCKTPVICATVSPALPTLLQARTVLVHLSKQPPQRLAIIRISRGCRCRRRSRLLRNRRAAMAPLWRRPMTIIRWRRGSHPKPVVAARFLLLGSRVVARTRGRGSAIISRVLVRAGRRSAVVRRRGTRAITVVGAVVEALGGKVVALAGSRWSRFVVVWTRGAGAWRTRGRRWLLTIRHHLRRLPPIHQFIVSSRAQ
jgi:hypothetical protein